MVKRILKQRTLVFVKADPQCIQVEEISHCAAGHAGDFVLGLPTPGRQIVRIQDRLIQLPSAYPRCCAGIVT